MKLSVLLAGSALSSLCHALLWDGPQPTNANTGKLRLSQGFTPRPTDGPSPAKAALELAKNKREYVPNNYCGFIEGMSDSIVSCSIGRTCYFYQFPASQSIYGMRGCCTAADSLNCGWALDCVESKDFSKSCGTACQSDTFTLKCTNPTRPYCNSYKYPDPGILDFGCGSTSYTGGWRTVSTTYDGQSAPSNSLLFASGALNTNGPVTRGGALGGLSRTTSSTKSTRTPTSTPIPIKKKSSPIGAIVGGVIGGLLLIGAAIVAAVAVCLRSRRKKRRAAAGVAAPPQAGTQYPPGQGPGGYAPVQQQQPPVPPMQQQQQQPPQGAAAGYYSGPTDQKGMPSPSTQEVNQGPNTSYYGAAGAPPKQDPPFSERPFSAEIDGTPHGTPPPGSPLPAYARGSYVPPPPPPQPQVPQNTHQLHSESAGPMVNAQGQTVYEAPGSHQ